MYSNAQNEILVKITRFAVALSVLRIAFVFHLMDAMFANCSETAISLLLTLKKSG
jgi:hypothetical protein